MNGDVLMSDPGQVHADLKSAAVSVDVDGWLPCCGGRKKTREMQTLQFGRHAVGHGENTGDADAAGHGG